MRSCARPPCARAPAALCFSPNCSDTYHRVGTLRFDTMADLQKAVESPEGQATAADLPNFATGGFQLLFFDTIDI